TSAGSAASIDLCLHLVRQDYGAEAATRVARDLVVPPYRDGGQAQYIDTPLPKANASDLFADTVAWRFAATTGTTPYQWLLDQRLRLAQRMLETGDLTVDAVAQNSGFINAG